MKTLEEIIDYYEAGIKAAKWEYDYDKLGGTGVFRPGDAANDEGRIEAYTSLLRFIKGED